MNQLVREGGSMSMLVEGTSTLASLFKPGGIVQFCKQPMLAPLRRSFCPYSTQVGLQPPLAMAMAPRVAVCVMHISFRFHFGFQVFPLILYFLLMKVTSPSVWGLFAHLYTLLLNSLQRKKETAAPGSYNRRKETPPPRSTNQACLPVKTGVLWGTERAICVAGGPEDKADVLVTQRL